MRIFAILIEILTAGPVLPGQPPAFEVATVMRPMLRSLLADRFQLASTLTAAVGRPVDHTELEGSYFCAVTYSPLAAPATGNVTDASSPDIFEAVQQQLGQKLESRRESLELLVVDQAERTPAEN